MLRVVLAAGLAFAALPAAAQDAPQTPSAETPLPTAPADPRANCRVPPAGALTLRRDDIVASGTLQLRFLGRDPSFPQPSVYCIQTNAELRNADGSTRDNATFCIWEGFVQRARICGIAISMSLTRPGDDQVTLNIRR